jgi:hypothetical protein
VTHFHAHQGIVLDAAGGELGGQFGLVEDGVVADVAVMALAAHVEAGQRQVLVALVSAVKPLEETVPMVLGAVSTASVCT